MAGLCLARAQGRERELPNVSKKKAPSEVRLAALLVQRGSRVLLARRQEGGLFAGLWEPPMVELAGDVPVERAFAQLLDTEVAAFVKVAEQTHVLTHRRMRICVGRAELASEPHIGPGQVTYDQLAWHSPKSRKTLGMSSLAKKVLSCARGEL